MELTRDGLAGALINEGVPYSDAMILGAVAGGESGYRPGAENLSDIEESIGLFQINTWAHYDKLEAATGSSNKADWFAWLKVPENNVKMAAQVYKSQGLGAWSVYTNGAYLNYMGDYEAPAVDRSSGGRSGSATSGAAAGPAPALLIFGVIAAVLVLRG